MRGLKVYGSESQLMTALANLVENAVAYSRDAVPDRPAARVTITTAADADFVEVTVADEGIGIEARDLDRIFERFYRADKARSRATGGTGLGPRHRQAHRHQPRRRGGRAQPVGEGSTFTLRLPLRPPDAPLPLPASIEIAAGPAAAPPRPGVPRRKEPTSGPRARRRG